MKKKDHMDNPQKFDTIVVSHGMLANQSARIHTQ